MAQHKDSNPAEFEESKRVEMRVIETIVCVDEIVDIIYLGLDADEMLLNHLIEILSSASGEKLAEIKLLSGSITARRDAKLQMRKEISQIEDKSFEDLQHAREMKRLRDVIDLGNAYIASVEKLIITQIPFAQNVYPSFDRSSTEMKRILSIPPIDENLLSQISAKISEYRSKLESGLRDLNRTPFVRKSLQAKKVPRETSTLTIGREAEKIEVGGCKITFPAWTFTGSQPVTVTTEIDVDNWPPGRKAITSTLPSWCRLEDDNVGIDLMQFNENAKTWSVITPATVRNKDTVEFQSREAAQYIGTLRPKQSAMEVSMRITKHAKAVKKVPREMSTLTIRDEGKNIEVGGCRAYFSIAKKVPRETSTVTIGREAKEIEVGGCKVTFLDGTFAQAQPVTVTTEIDVEKWPPGRKAITSTLSFNAKNLKKPATLSLDSWCRLEDDNVGIDLMQFNENAKTWNVITPATVRNKDTLEFQSREAGQYIGTLRPKQSAMATYVVRPIICFKNSNFVVALIRNSKLDRNQLMDDLKQDFGDDFMTKHFSALPCDLTQTINSCIKCVDPRRGFEFVASGSFSHSIQDIINYSISSYGLCQLKSDAPKMNVTLMFQLRDGDMPLRMPDCFLYCWEPVTTGEKERLEDVFTEISSRFASTQEFEKFAYASTGLRLSFVEVDEINSDKKTEFGRRVAMILLWRQKRGERCTAANLRKLADRYFESNLT